jgi:dienelactone hydrolase
MRSFPILVLLFASGLAQAAVPFTFPNPPGPFAVGFRVVHQYDHARAYKGDVDDVTGKPVAGERARPIQTLVWYPAAAAGKPMIFGDYLALTGSEDDFTRSDTQQRALADELVKANYLSESGPEQGSAALAGPMRARRDATPSAGTFPVVIYAPSISAPAAENPDLCEYLASHGYIVIASPSLGPHGRDMPNTLDGAETQAADIAFLSAYAHTLPQAAADRLAVAGYSWGGIANVFVAAKDSRIKALVNLDGSVRYYPELVAAAKYVTPQSVRVPMLFLAARPSSLEDIARRGKPATSFLNDMKYADLYKLTMLPMEHFAFSSTYLRFAPERRYNQYPRTEVERAFGWSAAYVLHFLDAWLKDDAKAKAWLVQAPAEHGIPAYAATMEARPAASTPPGRMQLAATLSQRGFDHAHEIYQAMHAQEPSFELKEGELNAWGYGLLRAGQAAQAVEIFKLATILYPASGNAFDSLAEAYEGRGDKPNAILHYQRSLQLDPGNDNARAHLQALGAPEAAAAPARAG